MQRAVRIAKEALEAKGYELVPFELTKEEILEISDIMFGLISPKSLGPLMVNLHDNYESPLSMYKMANLLYNNTFMRWLAKLGMKLSGNSRIATSLDSLRPMSNEEYETYIYR